MDINEEKKLILAARTNPELFGQVFDEYHPKILNYLIRRTADVHLSQDLAADVFVKAFDKLWQFRFKGLPFSAWLYQIANNEIRMHFRSKKPILSLDLMMDQYGFDIADYNDFSEEIKKAEEMLEQHEDFLQIQKQISNLPLIYQEVLSLRFFEDKSLLQIASILGKKEGTIKSLLSRGLQKIREAMQPL